MSITRNDTNPASTTDAEAGIENKKRFSKEEIIDHVALVLPISFVWMVVALFVLILSFDMLEFVEAAGIYDISNNYYLLILLMLILGSIALGAILGTGLIVDREPNVLIPLTSFSMIGVILGLILDLIGLQTNNIVIIVIALLPLFFFFGSLAVSANTLVGLLLNSHNRAKIYAIPIFIFAISSVIILDLTALLRDTFQLDIPGFNFKFPLLIMIVFGIGANLIFWYVSKHWQMKAFDAVDYNIYSLKNIIQRKSVQRYFLSHVMFYLMLSLSVINLSKVGELWNFGTGLELGSYTAFWVTVLLGSFIFIFMSGYLADLKGRKNSLVIAAYFIIFASLIVGLLHTSDFGDLFMSLAAFTIGIAFSLVHTTLDSSVWFDLSPKNAIGRYTVLNYLSLGLGLGTGYVLGFMIDIPISINVFLIIGFSVLALLPIINVNDTFPPLKIKLLLVLTKAGVPVYYYRFEEEEDLKVSYSLISGALSAINSFMAEAIQESGAKLNLVNHGSYYIVTESQPETELIATAFSNKNDLELQVALKKFLRKFSERHGDFKDFVGKIKSFEETDDLVEDMFAHLVTI